MLLLSLFLAVVLEGFQRSVLIGFDRGTLSGALLVSLIQCILFLSLLFSLGKLMRIEEFSVLLKRPWRKITGGEGSS
jgi:hypothetical protein